MVKDRLALWSSSRLTANRLLPLAPLKAIFLSKRANKILIINISQKIGIEWSNFAPKNLSFNRLVDLHFFAGIKQNGPPLFDTCPLKCVQSKLSLVRILLSDNLKLTFASNCLSQFSPLGHDEDNYFSSLSNNGGGVSPNKIPRYEQNNFRELQQQQQQQYLQLPRYLEQQQLIFPPEVIIHVPSGPIYFNESMDWKSNIVYSPSPTTEHWNPNLTGKVETILRTYQMSLGELQNTGQKYSFIVLIFFVPQI